MKTRQDNYMIDRNDAVYTENDTEPLWLIWLGPNFDENQMG